MVEDKNNSVPVIIGVVGDAAGLKSLEPVFNEFRKTFGDSTPIKVLQMDTLGKAKLFGEENPDSIISLENILSVGEKISSQDMATYMLRNCHFVLLSKQEKISPDLQEIYSAVEACAIELPANMPSVDKKKISVFDLPEPPPVLIQTEQDSLKMKIASREKERKPCETAQTFSLGLFQYEQRKTGIKKYWNELTCKPYSIFDYVGDAKQFEFCPGKNDPLSETDPLGNRWLNCVEGLHRLAEFNREVHTAPDGYNQLDRFGLKAAPNGFELMCQNFCKADVLALNYQTRWQELRFTTINSLAKGEWHPKRIFSFLYLAALAAFLLAFSIDFGYVWGDLAGPVPYLAYASILFVSFLFLYHTARVERWEQKHQDYRFIAEVLAIQLHWSLAGIRDYASDHFPMGIKNDVQWVRRVVHTARFLSSLDTITVWSLDETCEKWIGKNENDKNGQLNYHLFKMQKRRKDALHSLKKKRKYSGVAFVVLFLILTGLNLYEVSHFIFGGHVSIENVQNTENWIKLFHPYLIVAMATSLVIFALLGEAIEGYGIEQELTRSEELVDVYRRCLSEFAKNPGNERKRNLLEDVGRFAVDAEAHWLVLHRERPLQPVKGG